MVALKVEIQEGCPNVEVLIQCPEITEDIRRLEALVLSGSPKLLCAKDQKQQLVDRRDVLYIESVDKRCFVYVADDVFETDLKLYELEELLDPAGFFRSAKSQIINIAKIKSLCPDFGGRIEVEMETGEKVIISRQYAKGFKERIGLR
ncbi:MAG: LytTR family transcriptional regulator [Oscillospiraceae bacterium]|nr:LytTR family transcriptional regulator [Oscillospiraceae bacterium]